MIRLVLVADNEEELDYLEHVIGRIEHTRIVESTIGIGHLPNRTEPADLIVCNGFEPEEIASLIDRCELSVTGVVVVGDSAHYIDLREVHTPVGLIEDLDDRRAVAALIRAVSSGLSARTPELRATVLDTRGESEDLTPREREVLHYVAGGFSNAEIASYLSITANTVKYHLAQILKKLGAANRTEAVLRAIQSGELEA